jgi:hypothetical protein
MALKEYKPGTAFTGVIGRTFDVSQPAWPQPKGEVNAILAKHDIEAAKKAGEAKR